MAPNSPVQAPRYLSLRSLCGAGLCCGIANTGHAVNYIQFQPESGHYSSTRQRNAAAIFFSSIFLKLVKQGGGTPWPSAGAVLFQWNKAMSIFTRSKHLRHTLPCSVLVEFRRISSTSRRFLASCEEDITQLDFHAKTMSFFFFFFFFFLEI